MSNFTLLALAALAALAAAGTFAALWLRARRRVAFRSREIEAVRDGIRAADEAREAFFDLVTHELRSPLSAILGYQELLSDGAYGSLDGKADEPVERIGRSARHLLHLIDGVVELSRIRTGGVRLDLGSVNLGGLIASLADAFRTHARDRGLEPHVQMPSALPTIRSDQDRLVRALDLTVTSALKHPAVHEIRMSVTSEDDGATIHIADTYLEIRDDVQDPALRLGIRLAVAESLARALGGDLQLHTDNGIVRALSFRIRDHDRAPSPTPSSTL